MFFIYIFRKCWWFTRYLISTSSPFRFLIKEASPFFLMLYESSSKNGLHIITKYLWGKSYCWKTAKQSDAFSNSIFEPYRASALFKLETWDSKGTSFSPLSIIRENLKKLSWVVSEEISEQNNTLKIGKSSITRTGSDVITQKNIKKYIKYIYI